MRILHIITSLRTGGAEKLVTGLLPRFLQEGHDVQLLLLDGTRTPLFTDLEASGVRIHALSKGAAAMRNPFLFGRMVRFLRKGRFDVVHTHNTSCQFLASGASLLMPLRLVTTEHNTSNRRRRRAFYRPLDRWMYSHHATDPCSQQLVNAFDMVRLHLFGDKDADNEEILGNPLASANDL